MKLRLNRMLRRAVMACMTAVSAVTLQAFADVVYITDGVNKDNVTASERFYDTGKGHYFPWVQYSNYFNDLKAEYNAQGSFRFLGDLYERMPASAPNLQGYFVNLSGDGDTCWAQAAMNAVEYWNSYYGVFYQGSRELLYGYTYDEQYLPMTGGTLSLKQNLALLDTFTNEGDNFGSYVNWYMKGDDRPDYSTVLVKGQGGYWADVFGTASAYTYKTINRYSEMTAAVTSLMGYEKNSNGQYTQTTKGQLLSISMSSSEGSGHSIAGHGFTLNAAGQVSTLWVTNSDDVEYSLFPLYLDPNQSTPWLYEDAACTRLWEYSDEYWYVDYLYSIKTPQVLKTMYEQYSDPERALWWNGYAPGGVLSMDTGSTAELPTAETGWDAYIRDAGELSGYYHSWYGNCKFACFNDDAVRTTVQINGTLNPYSVQFLNADKAYTVNGTGTSSGGINVNFLYQGNGGAVQMNNMRLVATETRLNAGTMTLNSSLLRGWMVGVEADATLKLHNSTLQLTSSTATLTLGGALMLSGNSSVALNGGTMVFQAGSTLSLGLTSASTGSASVSIGGGSLSFNGAVNLVVSGSGLVDSTTYYLLGLTGFNASQLSNISCSSGILGYDGRYLTLTYYASTWRDYSGTWSATRWAGNYESKDGSVARFAGSSGVTNNVSVSGAVAPSSVYIASGHYAFSNAGNAALNTGLLQVAGTASLSMDFMPNASRLEVGGSAALTLKLSGERLTLPTMALSAGGTLTLDKSQSAVLYYTAYDPATLKGSVNVASGVGLTLRGRGDVALDASFHLASGAALYLNPEDSTQNVSYTLSHGVQTNGGFVVIGYNDDTLNSVARVYTPAENAAEYYVWKTGELVLQGEGTFSGKVHENGKLVVDSAADVTFSLSSNAPLFDEGVRLQVLGHATVGSEAAGLNSRLADSVTVQGTLTLGVDCTVGATSSKKVSLDIPSLTLDSGTLEINAFFANPQSWKNLRTNNRVYITELTLDGAGTIIRKTPDGHGFFAYCANVSIAQLKGSGNLTLDVDTWNQMSRYYLTDTTAFTGNINVLNSSVWRENADSNGNVVHFHVNVLELANQRLNGRVHLAVPNRTDYATAALGIKGNVTVRGLSSLDNGPVYLFSGEYSQAECLTEKGFFYHTTADASACLAIDTGASSYSFAGTVGASLSLEKLGSGTQSFTGDMSAFNGAMTVRQGVLDIKRAFTASAVSLAEGTLLRARSGASINALTLSGNTRLEASGGQLTLTHATVSGCNVLEAQSIQGSEWVFRLDGSCRKEVMLSMLGSSASGTFSLGSLTLQYDAQTLSNGLYYLFAYDDELTWSGDINLTNSPSDAYRWINETVGGEKMYILVYEHSTGVDAPLDRDFTTLTWTGSGTLWASTCGEESSAWSAAGTTVDLNYYNGDSVLFNKAGKVRFRGALRPAAVTVSNSSGTVELVPEDAASSLQGGMSLAKSGAGTLYLGGNNGYTGGTVLHAGVLQAGSATALGTGAVTVNGGTLNLGDYAVKNSIIAKGGSISATGHKGLLSVQGAVTLLGNGTEGAIELCSGSVLKTSAGMILDAGDTLTAAGGSVQGNLTLNGGELVLGGAALSVSGTFAVNSLSSLSLSGYELGKEYTLVYYGAFAGDVDLLTLPSTGSPRLAYELTAGTGALTLRVVESAGSLIWLGGKKTVWAEGHTTLWNDGAAGSAFFAGDHVTFTAGTISISGQVRPGSIAVANDKTASFKTSYNKKTGLYSGEIAGSATLSKYGKGKFTLNDGNLNWYGDSHLYAGTLTAKGVTSFGRGDIYVHGGVLDLASKAVTNDIELQGSAVVKGGKKYLGAFTLQQGDLLKGSSLNVYESATLCSGTVSGSLYGNGTTVVAGEVALASTGKVTTAGLSVQGELTTSTKGLAMNTKTSAIEVEKGAYLLAAGAIKAYSLEVWDADVELSSAKASSLSLNGALNLHSGAAALISGKVSVGSLSLQNASLTLYDPSTKNKAQSLTSKGALTLGSGAAITLNGKITAKDLTLNGGSITLSSAKWQTIAVKNQLTLNGSVDLNLCCNLSVGKAYKLFTYKYHNLATYSSEQLLNMLGLQDAGCTLSVYNKYVTLTVLNPYLWQDYISDNLAALSGVQDAAVEEAPPAESPEAEAADEPTEVVVNPEELLLQSAPAADELASLPAKVADTLAQSTWGVVGASRAFGETIANRGRHATLLGNAGQGAAWVSVMGGSSRISSAEGHSGADFTLSGAAFGAEARLTQDSTLGVAIGNSWGKVSTFSAFTVELDSVHVGIYGNHQLCKSLTLSWMASHSRSESEASLLGAPYSWSQDALQLDARLTWGKSLSEKTAVSAFVGLQYLATDSAECSGLKTGSVQNLRAELGVGASHRAGENTLLFGELSFIGDMVRHNPTAAIGDYRTHGTNPGRAGLNLSVGAEHRLSEDWSMHASYSLELMENSTSHSLNLGASYSF